MGLNGTYLARAREALEAQRARNEAEQARRERTLYARVPRIAAIDAELRAQMIELFGYTLRHGSDPTAQLREIEARNLALQDERAKLLEENGFPKDYSEPVCACRVCGDTGYLADGSICECLMTLYNQELTKDLSSLLQTGDEEFDRFDLTLYAPEHREQMAQTLRLCRQFAEEFTPGAPSLLLQGGTGLGKTFLSGCIARTVAQLGFGVVYESAAAALGAFETAKFQRFHDAGEQAADKVEQYLSCDLMILDDLGTEMVSPYSVSALYTLINTRLTQHKTTIISTNCTDAELQRNYTPQILSRIEGEFLALPFVGRDIRQVKKERSI